MASNLNKHRRVKTLGTYLAWTKIKVGVQEVHLIAVYLEPGNEERVANQRVKLVNLVQSVLQQD